MKGEIEIIKLKEKDKNDLKSVTFVPPKFGTFLLWTTFFGFSIATLIYESLLWGFLTMLVCFGGMMMSYINSEKW